MVRLPTAFGCLRRGTAILGTVTEDPFADELANLGFSVHQRDRKGTVQYSRRPNRYLTEWVHDYGDEALFTWEFDLGEFCSDVGWQIGAA